MGKSDKKEDLNIWVMIFCIIGVVATVLGIMLLKNVSFRMTIIGTEGSVVGVQTASNANGEIERVTANVSYQANKTGYTANVNTDNANVKLGDKMTLYYDFFKPEAVSLKRGGYQGYISLLIGLILVLKTGPRFYRILKDNYL